MVRPGGERVEAQRGQEQERSVVDGVEAAAGPRLAEAAADVAVQSVGDQRKHPVVRRHARRDVPALGRDVASEAVDAGAAVLHRASILKLVAETLTLQADDKAGRYSELMPQLRSLVDGEPDLIANLANLSAALMQGIEAASWVGFYILRGGELVLGPFQGKVACVRIALGRGVCGTAAAERRTLVVPDVEAFPGHIACDPASRSEIVVPIIRRGELCGVLDVDSSSPGSFDETDAAALAEVAALAADLRW